MARSRSSKAPVAHPLRAKTASDGRGSIDIRQGCACATRPFLHSRAVAAMDTRRSLMVSFNPSSPVEYSGVGTDTVGPAMYDTSGTSVEKRAPSVNFSRAASANRFLGSLRTDRAHLDTAGARFRIDQEVQLLRVQGTHGS